MTTIRDALATARPHVSLKQAWISVIQHSRDERRKGIPRTLFKRSQVERFLQQDLPPNQDIGALKGALWDVLNHQDSTSLVRALNAIDAWVNACDGSCPDDCPVKIEVSLGEAPIHSAQIDRWLGTSRGTIELPAIEAAKWLHHLGGRIIAGVPLTVRPSYSDPRPLPRVARKDRSRMRSDGQKGWLPHLDEVARFSATPESIAHSHAQEFRGCSVVVDPFCGAGGDAVAVAMSGPTVLASDISGSRLELARANADHFGVTGRVHFRVSSAEAAISTALLKHHDPGLYLDPPWGGTEWAQATMSLDTLFGLIPDLEGVLSQFMVVVIKLPRTFPVEQLGRFGGRWEFQFGLDSRMADPVDRLKTIIAIQRQSG